MATTTSLTSAFRTLCLRTTLTHAARPALQRRSVSQAALLAPRAAAVVRPSIVAARPQLQVQQLQQQQTRGMKVHSSVKKRCEHCKVSLDEFVLCPGLDLLFFCEGRWGGDSRLLGEIWRG